MFLGPKGVASYKKLLNIIGLNLHDHNDNFRLSSSYGRMAILLTDVIGWVLDPVALFAGLLTIIASLGRSDLSVTCSSELGTCFRWGATTFGVVVKHDLRF